jgi:hypothetical protein
VSAGSNSAIQETKYFELYTRKRNWQGDDTTFSKASDGGRGWLAHFLPLFFFSCLAVEPTRNQD